MCPAIVLRACTVGLRERARAAHTIQSLEAQVLLSELRLESERMKSISKAELFRLLPSVDELLRRPELAELLEREGRAAVTDAARSVLLQLRQEVTAGALDEAQLK